MATHQETIPDIEDNVDVNVATGQQYIISSESKILCM